MRARSTRRKRSREEDRVDAGNRGRAEKDCERSGQADVAACRFRTGPDRTGAERRAVLRAAGPRATPRYRRAFIRLAGRAAGGGRRAPVHLGAGCRGVPAQSMRLMDILSKPPDTLSGLFKQAKARAGDCADAGLVMLLSLRISSLAGPGRAWPAMRPSWPGAAPAAQSIASSAHR